MTREQLVLKLESFIHNESFYHFFIDNEWRFTFFLDTSAGCSACTALFQCILCEFISLCSPSNLTNFLSALIVPQEGFRFLMTNTKNCNGTSDSVIRLINSSIVINQKCEVISQSCSEIQAYQNAVVNDWNQFYFPVWQLFHHFLILCISFSGEDFRLREPPRETSDFSKGNGSLRCTLKKIGASPGGIRYVWRSYDVSLQQKLSVLLQKRENFDAHRLDNQTRQNVSCSNFNRENDHNTRFRAILFRVKHRTLQRLSQME